MKLVDASLTYYRTNLDKFKQYYPADHPCNTDSGYQPVLPVCFEICGAPVDKTPLTMEDVYSRLLQFESGNLTSHMQSNSNNYKYDHTAAALSSSTFAWNNPFASVLSNGIGNIHCCLTSKSLFVEKSALFRKSIFVIGVDTLVRLFDPKYYQHSAVHMLISLHDIIANNKCMFIVGGRVNNGKFQVLAEAWVDIERSLASSAVVIPEYIKQAFHGLSEAEYRLDISSTELRRQA